MATRDAAQEELELLALTCASGVCTCAKITIRGSQRESCSEVVQEDVDRQSIVLEILLTSTDFLRRICVPVEGQGAVSMSYVCPHCHRFSLEDYIWWVSAGHGNKQCNWWCAACGGQYNWKAPNRVLVKQDSTDRREAKVFQAHAAAHKLFTNWKKDGDRTVKVMVQGLQERSRLKRMDGLRRFIMVDNDETVKVDELDENMESKKVVKTKFTIDFRNPVVREGADELTAKRRRMHVAHPH